MANKKAKFTCQKCGAVHVFTRNGDDFDVEVEEPKTTAKKKGTFFDWLIGEDGETTEGKENEE